MQKIILVLPTYNEAENIEKFIGCLFDEFPQLEKSGEFKFEILVVDDFSPDGTGDIVKDLAAKKPKINLIQKEKQGLGAAYIFGFKHAIDKLGADWIVEMDSDFSHKPKDLPSFIEATKEGATFIIGSRYVKGGSIPSDWPLLRKLNSKFGNIFARYVAGLYDVKDCTSGFRLINVELLKKLDLDKLNANGYSFQMNILYELVQLGAVVKEVPIQFVDRELGKSKLGLKDILEFMKNAVTLRLKRTFKR